MQIRECSGIFVREGVAVVQSFEPSIEEKFYRRFESSHQFKFSPKLYTRIGERPLLVIERITASLLVFLPFGDSIRALLN